MSGEGSLKPQVKRAYDVFASVGLAKSFNRDVRYPNQLAVETRHRSYREQWEYHSRMQYFDIQLADWSFLQFRIPSRAIDVLPSYSYYECPLAIPTYRQFLRDVFDVDEAVVGDCFWSDYEEQIFTAALKDCVTPLRFDYCPGQYTEGVHPAAHLHIGHNSNVRLFAERIMEPLSFALFVLRQVYPKPWKLFLESSNAPKICRAVRQNIVAIANDYYLPLDLHQLVLK